MEEGLFNQILHKMDILLKLTALNVVKGREAQEQIKLLAQAGLRNIDIADLLGKSPANINVTLMNLRKKKRDK